MPSVKRGRPTFATSQLRGSSVALGDSCMKIACSAQCAGGSRLRAGCAAASVPDGRSVSTEPARYAGGDWREDRDLEQLHLVIGFPGVTLGDPDYYAASVLSTALGGGMSSRLFQEIREKRGLVYAIHSFVHGYRDAGLFGIYAGTGEDEAAELLPALCDEASKLQDGLTAIELDFALRGGTPR